jgi:hypothetical protein
MSREGLLLSSIKFTTVEKNALWINRNSAMHGALNCTEYVCVLHCRQFVTILLQRYAVTENASVNGHSCRN